MRILKARSALLTTSRCSRCSRRWSRNKRPEVRVHRRSPRSTRKTKMLFETHRIRRWKTMTSGCQKCQKPAHNTVRGKLPTNKVSGYSEGHLVLIK